MNLFVKYGYELKDLLSKSFGNHIAYYKEGVTSKVIVHSVIVNPCQYAVATMKGAGLRDDDLTKAFARLVRRKLKASELQSWPISPEELLHRLDDAGPLTFIFNAIVWTVNPAFAKNHFGYAKTSSASLSEKIWAVASDWQSLVTHERSSRSTALSLIVHRLTGSKEVTSLLHKLGHGISYKDVRLLTNSWAQNVKRSVPAVLVPGKPFHVTLDNSDEKQQTLTGAETTHHTNGTVFQNNATVSEEAVQISAQVVEEKLCLIDEDNLDYGTYKIPKKVNPPAVPEFEERVQTDLLEWCLARDIARVTVSSLGTSYLLEEETDISDYIGSWTAFIKDVTDSDTQKACLEYLEIVPLPPDDTVCKYYCSSFLSQRVLNKTRQLPRTLKLQYSPCNLVSLSTTLVNSLYLSSSSG